MGPSDMPAQSQLWRDGWYQFASRQASPNFGPRPLATQPDLIVLHCISLPPGRYGGDEVQRLFANQLDWNQHPYFKGIEGLRVSSHFYIRRHGELLQFVSADERAWHAGLSHHRGRSDCNNDSVGIELEGVEGGIFEDSQYESLAGLCAGLLEHYPITDIAGHEHVAAGRKTDPGPGFEWRRLQQMLGLPSTYFPPGSLPSETR